LLCDLYCVCVVACLFCLFVAVVVLLRFSCFACFCCFGLAWASASLLAASGFTFGFAVSRVWLCCWPFLASILAHPSGSPFPSQSPYHPQGGVIGRYQQTPHTPFCFLPSPPFVLMEKVPIGVVRQGNLQKEEIFEDWLLQQELYQNESLQHHDYK